VLKINITYFFELLAVPSDVDQYWPKHVKAIFYILILNLLHLMGLSTLSCNKKCNGSVGITSGYGRDSIPSVGKIFSSPQRPRLTLGPTQPPSQWILRTLSPAGKRLGREADHSLPSGAELTNVQAIPPLPSTS
jgi:hypothetical protein